MRVLDMIKAIVVLIVIAAVGKVLPARAITIDGVFSDWTDQQIVGTDRAGDIGAGDVVDWLTAWAKFENSALYLAFRTQGNIDFAQNAWRYGVLLDTDSVSSTGYRGAASEYALGAEYLVEGATVYKYAGKGADWTWSRVAGSATYAIAGNRLEMRIAASMIGMTSKSKIKIMLVGKNDGTYDFARDDKAGFAYPRDPIVVDGAFTDWAAVTPLGTDATGDVSPNDIVDWLDLRALGQNGTLYLSYTTAKPIDLANNGSRYDVLIDADNNNRSGYTNIPGGIGAEFLIEGATLFKYAGDGATWQWTPVTRVGAAVAASRLELAVAASHLGLSDTQFNIRLRLLGNNRGTWDLAPDLAPGFSYKRSDQTSPVSCQRMAIPSYFTNTALWDQAISRAPQTQIMLINPINGPGEAPRDDLAVLAAKASAAGMTVLGYVSTGYSGRDPALVKQDIGRYAEWYKTLDGIFLDEVSVYCSVHQYYQDIDDYIGSFLSPKNKRFITVLNNGNYPGECYMSAGDIVVYEQAYSTFKSATPPSWVFNYAPERFWNIIWQTSQSQMSAAIDTSRRRNVGYVYVTNDALPNPYDSLPSYWTAEMKKISELCN